MSYTTRSSDGLMQYRPPMLESVAVGLPNATEDEETTNLSGKTMLSPEISCTNYGDLDPKASKTKPNRRRPRDKKTPMILLNANTTNFRALVQQFTGCQSASSSSFKGPINLNFGGGTEENDVDIADHQPINMFGYNNFAHKIQAAQDQQHQQLQLEDNMKQLYEEDQEHVFSSGSFDGDAPLSTYGNPATYTSTIENMVAENNIFFHNFPGDFSSGDFASSVLPDDDNDFIF